MSRFSIGGALDQSVLYRLWSRYLLPDASRFEAVILRVLALGRHWTSAALVQYRHGLMTQWLWGGEVFIPDTTRAQFEALE